MRVLSWTSCCALAACSSPPLVEPELVQPVPVVVEDTASDPEPTRELRTEWHDNGLKAVEGWLVDGRRHGRWRAWYDDGHQAWEGRYDHGLVNGLWTYWDKLGRKQHEMEFVADELRRKRLYRKGKLSTENSYVENLLDGPETSYRHDGTKLTWYRYRGERIEDPWQSQSVEALGYRLKHSPDADERLEAVRALAGHLPFPEDSVLDLVRGLRDPDSQVVRECITVLGMAGEDAAAALPALQELAGHEDAQTAERARAALRQIEPR